MEITVMTFFLKDKLLSMIGFGITYGCVQYQMCSIFHVRWNQMYCNTKSKNTIQWLFLGVWLYVDKIWVKMQWCSLNIN